MLEAGYASVAEFHYLHHQPGGAPYADPAELAPPHRRRRRRRRHRPDAAARPLQPTAAPAARRSPAASSASATTSTPSSRCARRAAPALAGDARPRRRAALAARHHPGRSSPRWPPLAPTARCTSTPPSRCSEVEQVDAWLGARPVEFLLDRDRPRPALVPDPRHPDDPRRDRRARRAPAPSPASARSPRPTSATASSTAPPTSPPAARFGIGSDSNVRIALAEELREPRIQPAPARRARNVLAAPGRLRRRDAPRRAPSPAAPRRSGATAARSAPGALADLVAHRPRPPDARAARRRPAPRRLDLRRRRPAWCARSGPPAATWSATAATSPATPSRPLPAHDASDRRTYLMRPTANMVNSGAAPGPTNQERLVAPRVPDWLMEERPRLSIWRAG